MLLHLTVIKQTLKREQKAALLLIKYSTLHSEDSITNYCRFLFDALRERDDDVVSAFLGTKLSILTYT